MDNWNKENNGSFVLVGKVYLELIGVYFKKVKSLKDLKDGVIVLVSSNVVDYGWVLMLFKDVGLIILKKGIDLILVIFNDIKINKCYLKFKYLYEVKLMLIFYKNNEGDVVVINVNYVV